MTDLLASDHPVVVSGTVANQVLFYDRFAAIVLLSAPLDVLLERVSTRASNPYGRTLGDQQSIRRYVRDIEPLLREGPRSNSTAASPSPPWPIRSSYCSTTARRAEARAAVKTKVAVGIASTSRGCVAWFGSWSSIRE